MADRRQLRQVISMLTAGDKARVPRKLRARAAETTQAAASWLQGPGVQGVGIARRERGNRREPTLALKVYVATKLPPSRVETPVPATIQVSGIEEEIQTDVVEIGLIKPQANTRRIRPAPPGYSVGHPDVRYGTLGCLVRHPGDPLPYILSCAHVLADSGRGRLGDPILQPGASDQNEPGDYRIATLADFVPFATSPGYPNRVDAAIARADAPGLLEPAIRFLGVPRGRSAVIREQMQVQKTGRTTDLTTGLVLDIDFHLRMTYKIGEVGFRDLVLCTRFTADGDSGAAVLSASRLLLGIVVAGSSNASVFCRIGTILAALGVEPVIQSS